MEELDVDKGIIYYTDNRLKDPIFSAVQKRISMVQLPIVSVSLAPISFGHNIVLELEPSLYTMIRQILTALEASTADNIFFCEHDVLYHESHFDFTPPKNNMFYYNENVWRWKYPTELAITYDRLLSLSALCANREYVTNHYRHRVKVIEDRQYYKEKGHEPSWGRKMGYEPGTKKRRRGGITDDDYEVWRSPYPNIDIRHGKTYSRTKCSLDEFKHKPHNWRETQIYRIEGWCLNEI